MDKLSISDQSMKATCHCGAITVTAPKKPDSINECQCTICRRYGAAWAYYSIDEVEFASKEGSSTKKYIWGDKQLSFNFCGNCACVLYWYPILYQPVPPGGYVKMGINTTMVDPDELKHVNRTQGYDAIFEAIKTKGAAHAEDLAKY